MDYRRDNKFVITRTDIQRLLGDIKGLKMALEDDVCTENCKTTSTITDRQKIEYAQKKVKIIQDKMYKIQEIVDDLYDEKY